MRAQASFDADVARAMSRRQFLARLVRASGAALLMSSPLGCGTVRGGIERARLGDAAPIFNSVQQEVVAKIIDGFSPPDTEIRRLLEQEDPGYDPVAAYAEFAWASGDEFLGSMKVLIDFLNVLPTLTRTFSNRYGLPARLQLRRFHADDANRYFLFLRDSNIRALRNIFTGAKFIGTAPIYTNEKVAWKVMRYPGPWLLDPAKPEGDRAHATSFDMARETDENVAELRRRVVDHGALRGGLEAARVVEGSDRLVLETDVVVVGSGAGGSFVAAELAAKTGQRILILEKGDFVEPAEFLQRERFMMPRIFDTEFSVIEVFGTAIPTVSTAIVTGKLVGGSATINHALAFEPPRPVIRDWHDRLGVEFGYDDLVPHLEAIRTLLRIGPVPESQISGSNLALRRGAQTLGMPHHGPTQRNAHQCIGCGYCDLGCRYNRKLTPLNMVLPMAARRGAQVLANCRVEEVLLERLPVDGRNGRTHRVTGVVAQLTDPRGSNQQRVEIHARRVVLAAGPFASPRILMQSGVPALRSLKGSERSVGERFSTHATITFYADFDEALYPSAATPPMGYFVKKYDVEDQAAADPARDHVRYALEGMLNHPLAHAQLMPYESAESYQAFMKRFNQTMTLAVMFRDRPVGRVTPHGFEYALAEEDHAGWLDALRTGARIMFAAGGRRVFFNSHRPLILNRPEEIDAALTLDLVAEQRIQITSGHPMGGCALGGDARRDVVDSRGRSWDVDGLYVADSSLLPTSLGVNPCYTVYALGRYIAHQMVEDIRARG
ncbi:MAG TPA: GMC family oxidoreductase [Methylomirabilota bacterium]|nr:GMC family oxidoreductase [Methylomirabilota bacterium]